MGLVGFLHCTPAFGWNVAIGGKNLSSVVKVTAVLAVALRSGLEIEKGGEGSGVGLDWEERRVVDTSL